MDRDSHAAKGNHGVIQLQLGRLLIVLSLARPRILLLAALLSASLPGTAEAKEPAARVARNWEASPAILDLGPTPKIIAIGDVHGDYKRLVHMLNVAEVVSGTPEAPADVVWSCGSTVLICTGDLIDKGKHSLDVIACFRALQGQAKQAGGRVVVTMGNHEAEFLSDPEDDEKAEHFVNELEKAGIESADVAAGDDELGVGAFMLALPFAVKAGDWFFAHAGSTQGFTTDTLNRNLEDEVDEEGLGASILLGKRGLLEARLKPIPWWERDGDTPAESEQRLRGYATALGVKHLVIGHQPGKAEFSDGTKRKAGQMFEKFDGLIFMIDVGMSSAIDKSKGAVLKIDASGQEERATIIDSDGRETALWTQD